MDASADLIDSIYECAMLPDLWPDVLDRLARIAGARGGQIFSADVAVTNWTASESIRAGVANFANSDLIHRSSRFARLIGARHAGFLRDGDIYTDQELGDDPMYRDFLWPAGLGWAAGTAMQLPSGNTVVLSLERERNLGPVETNVIAHLDQLRPHIARSAMLSARLQLERAQVASETLALLDLPALVLDSGGRVVAANVLTDGLADYVQWRIQDRVALRDASADKLLRQAVVSLANDAAGAVRSFAVRQTIERPGLVAHVVPIRGTARDLFVRCAAILVLMPVTSAQAPPVELVQSLFDLTPAEARVARGLVSGDTVDTIATRGNVSAHTVRTQVRNILGKTGCSRQTDVVALLSGVRAPGP